MTSALLCTPFTTTTTGPVLTVLGIVTTICVLTQLVIEEEDRVVPLKLAVLLPCVVPKSLPVIVTDVPANPEVGETPATKGMRPVATDTLSNVAVVRAELLMLVTARPAYTLCPMLTA
jgi:hypothetical protein